MIRVGYLSEATFGEQAARAHFASRENVVYSSAGKTHKEVIDAVLKGKFDNVAIPIRNKLVPEIDGIYETLIAHVMNNRINIKAEVKIVGEEFVKVEQCLIAPAGVKLEDIRTVHSKKEALAQCGKFIAEHKLSTVEEESTAAGVYDILKNNLRDTAVIGNRLIAVKNPGMVILASNIQDLKDNYTHFIILGNQMPDKTGKDKTAIMLYLPNEPHVLANILGIFSAADVNIDLKTVPIKRTLNESLFIVYVNGKNSHIKDKVLSDAINVASEISEKLWIIGSYPEAIINDISSVRRGQQTRKIHTRMQPSMMPLRKHTA